MWAIGMQGLWVSTFTRMNFPQWESVKQWGVLESTRHDGIPVRRLHYYHRNHSLNPRLAQCWLILNTESTFQSLRSKQQNWIGCAVTTEGTEMGVDLGWWKGEGLKAGGSGAKRAFGAISKAGSGRVGSARDRETFQRTCGAYSRPPGRNLSVTIRW